MSDAEHLIENAIFSLKHGEDADNALNSIADKVMLEATGIKKQDIIAMAQHVVYSLYDGRFPETSENMEKENVYSNEINYFKNILRLKFNKGIVIDVNAESEFFRELLKKDEG